MQKQSDKKPIGKWKFAGIMALVGVAMPAVLALLFWLVSGLMNGIQGYVKIILILFFLFGAPAVLYAIFEVAGVFKGERQFHCSVAVYYIAAFLYAFLRSGFRDQWLAVIISAILSFTLVGWFCRATEKTKQD